MYHWQKPVQPWPDRPDHRLWPWCVLCMCVCMFVLCMYVCVYYACMCGTFSKEALVHLTSMATSQISLIRDSLKRPFLVKNYL